MLLNRINCNYYFVSMPKITNSTFYNIGVRDLWTGRRAKFDYTIIEDTTFENVDLRNIDFRGARLTNVKFIKCNLSRTDFRNATFSSVDASTSFYWIDYESNYLGSKQSEYRGPTRPYRYAGQWFDPPPCAPFDP